MDSSVLSLYELNNLVRGVLSETFSQRFWIRAETSDVRLNQNGHCYLEFIEKDTVNNKIIARARGSIWSNVFKLLKVYFESETQQLFTSGLKILVEVSVEFHELYGYSLTVHNIDPSYTLGDQVRKRALILKELEEEGVLTLNKELQFPLLPTRVAIISSPTAAGYEDFCDQLQNNSDGFVFYTHLFAAIMQGDKTEDSIIDALDRIYENVGQFDVVVIIRGGGAASELGSFDSYLLAANCAQFPLPIITGIGHERDDTVLDSVAHVRMKTPTAVAEFLIRKMQSLAMGLDEIVDSIRTLVDEALLTAKTYNDLFSNRFSYVIKGLNRNRISQLNSYAEKMDSLLRRKLIKEELNINNLSNRFSFLIKDKTQVKASNINLYTIRMRNAVEALLKREEHKLVSFENYVELASPENILKKGYTLTLRGGQIIKNVVAIEDQDVLTIRFHDGNVKVIVK